MSNPFNHTRLGRLGFLTFSILIANIGILPFIFILLTKDNAIIALSIIGSATIVFLTGIYIEIRRLRDFGWSGWWILSSFLPIINLILFFMLFFRRGDKTDNKFGPPPPPIQRKNYIFLFINIAVMILLMIGIVTLPGNETVSKAQSEKINSDI